MKLSVVIPAFNEEKQIGACLASLAAQKTSIPYEIIVVDNASTDNTAAVVKEYMSALQIRVIPEPYKSRGAARAAGFAAAEGDVICSTDADTIIPSTWIQTIAHLFEDENIGVISGTCYVSDSSPVVNYGFTQLQPLFMHVYRLLFGQYWLTGSNFAIRKSIYSKSGGFKREWGEQEDVELGFRINKISPIRFFGKPGVEVSGRRFKYGLITGLRQYVHSFLGAFVLKQTKSRLHDER